MRQRRRSPTTKTHHTTERRLELLADVFENTALNRWTTAELERFREAYEAGEPMALFWALVQLQVTSKSSWPWWVTEGVLDLIVQPRHQRKRGGDATADAWARHRVELLTQLEAIKSADTKKAAAFEILQRQGGRTDAKALESLLRKLRRYRRDR